MRIVRCTCCRDREGRMVVRDPDCPADQVHEKTDPERTTT